MKKSLGSLIVVLLFLSNLWASDLCDVNLSLSKPDPFVDEEILLSVDVKQKKFDNATFFEMMIPKSKIFEFKLLSKDEDKKRHIVRFRYRVIPKKSGRYNVPLSLKVKEASDESVNDFNTGSFDEMDFLHTKESIIKLKPLLIDVKRLKKSVEFIGDFKISCTIDKKTTKAYEPVYLSCEITGKGSYKKIKDLFKDINGVDKFLHKRDDLKFEYAFSSDKNFTIPPISISCYSPSKKSYYKLTTPPYHIKVADLDPYRVVDDKNSYPIKAYELSAFLPYIYTLLIFIAGYLSKKYEIFKINTKKIENEDPFKKEITKTATPKDLLKLLLSKDQSRFKKEIEELEEIIYQKSSNNFKKIKERLLK